MRCAAAMSLLTDHGRPGEWEHVSGTDMEEMEKDGRDYLIANDRKTVTLFGPVATCCPATQHALKFVCAFPSKGGPYNWEPRPP